MTNDNYKLNLRQSIPDERIYNSFGFVKREWDRQRALEAKRVLQSYLNR